MIVKRTTILFFSLLLTTQLFSQVKQLGETAEISIITVDPGKQLVDSFGHSAIRVNDVENGMDLAFNYGTYNFNAPNFYLNFARGKLNYELNVSRFATFFNYYSSQNRSVKEQILDLTQAEKAAFFEALMLNAREENKSYLYDFFFDNCATKIPEVTHNILNGKLTTDYKFTEEKDLSFRNLIHLYLDGQPWGKFGIDLALGSVIDRKAAAKEYLFLPDYVFEAYAHSSFKERPLVKKTELLFSSAPKEKQAFLFKPVVILSLISAMAIFLTFFDQKKKKRSKILDFLIFFCTGLIGLIVLLLWFGTDHTATANNFNFLWAFAPNIIIAFVLLKKELPKWIKIYCYFLKILLILTLILWFLKVQVFHMALIPVFLMLAYRYTFLARRSV